MRRLLMVVALVALLSSQGNADETVQECLDFLQRNMPSRDAGFLVPELLKIDAELALAARARTKWAKAVPWPVFLEYVLPYAVLDEAREHWRPLFSSTFAPLLEHTSSIEDAVRIINAKLWTIFNVSFLSDQTPAIRAPFETLVQHHASCTGVAILLVDALRAVGVPARLAGTVAWNTPAGGNHNWVEVLLPDDSQTPGWAFIEPINAPFNRTWFFPQPAKSATPGSVEHGIWAATFRRQQGGVHFPMIWAMADKSVPGIDVTINYITAH